MTRPVIVIDRAKWRCGGESGWTPYQHGLGDTALLNDEGYMCCLGFACRQLAPYADVLRIGEPADVDPDECGALVPFLLCAENDGFASTVLTRAAMKANDEPSSTHLEREWRVAEAFHKGGLGVSFVGEYES